MIFKQMTLEEIKGAGLSFSSIVSAQNDAEVPPEPTFKPSQKSIRAVFDVMKTGRWLTKEEISHYSGVSEHAISARLSDLKLEYGIRSEKRKAKDGNLFAYRLLVGR